MIHFLRFTRKKLHNYCFKQTLETVNKTIDIPFKLVEKRRKIQYFLKESSFY